MLNSMGPLITNILECCHHYTESRSSCQWQRSCAAGRTTWLRAGGIANQPSQHSFMADAEMGHLRDWPRARCLRLLGGLLGGRRYELRQPLGTILLRQLL